MAHFDIYATPFADERKPTQFWLDVQADHLQTLATRVIVPMRRMSSQTPVKQRLKPEFDVEGVRVYADTANIGTFPLSLLRRHVASLGYECLTMDDALDFLFTGY